MPRKSTINPDIRAAAIADLLEGMQPALVAEKHGVDAGTVRMWKTRYVAEDVAEAVEPVARIYPAVERRKERLGELLLDLLAAKLEASQAIAQVAADPAWLKRQSAADLATLVGTLDSTAFAIGDRLAGGHTPEASDNPGA